MNLLEQFEQYRPLLFSIAYRMLGTAAEAEDIVQEAYLRCMEKPVDDIQSPKAYFSAVVTRLCLNQLKSARMQREQYIGPWLPEPILTDTTGAMDSPEQAVDEMESISMAFLVLLEQLSPAERAAFLLREVFDYEYSEIARMLDKDEAACRQLYSRARRHIHDNRPRFSYSRQEHEQILGSFMQAVGEGRIDALMNLLAGGVRLVSDGGGKAASATRPLHGAAVVAKFFLGLQRRAPENFYVRVAEVNGQPAIIMHEGEAVVGVITAEVGAGQIQNFYIVRNPDKLRRLA